MKAWLLKFFGELGDFLTVLFKDSIQQQLKIILPIALKYVKQIANNPNLISGSEKRKAVFDAILDEIGDKQGDFKTHIINLAIEMAVVKFNDAVK